MSFEQIFASVFPSITMNSLKPQSFVRNISRKSSGFSAAVTPNSASTAFAALRMRPSSIITAKNGIMKAGKSLCFTLAAISRSATLQLSLS